MIDPTNSRKQPPTLTPVQEMYYMLRDANREMLREFIAEPPLGGTCKCPPCERKRAVRWQMDND